MNKSFLSYTTSAVALLTMQRYNFFETYKHYDV